MNKTILAVLIMMMAMTIAYAGTDEDYAPPEEDSTGAPADQSGIQPAPAPVPAPPMGAQPSYNFPTGAIMGQPPIIIVQQPPAPPAPQPYYPPPTPTSQNDMPSGKDVWGWVTGAAIGVLLIIAAYAIVNELRRQREEGNGAREALPYGTALQATGMMEGATSALAISPGGGMAYWQGNRPTGSAVMPAQNGGTAPTAPAPTGPQRTAAIAALTAAGIAAPTRRQQELAAEYVRDNFPGRRLNQPTINAAIAAEIAAGNI